MRKKPKWSPLGKRRKKSGYLRHHPFVVPVVTFLVLFMLTLAGFVGMGGQTIGASDSLVVRLTLNGERQILPTRAQTVGELLERLGVEVDEQDIVEPALDSEITVDNFEINVYTARPVLIDDDGRRFVLITAEPTARGIAKEAGLKVFPEDIVEKSVSDLSEPLEAINDGVIGERVVIERSTPVKLNLFGKVYDIRTHAETVRELIEEREVEYTTSSVFPDLDTELEANKVVFVTDPGKKIRLAEEDIPFSEERVSEPTLPAGQTRVRQNGSPGRRVVIYEIAKDGSRQALQRVVVIKPVNTIIEVGTGVVISNPSENVKLGQELAASRGWTGSEWFCLYQLWQRESGWSSTAGNPVTGAYGIPQALPGNKMGPGWQTDASVQINWGLGYIAGRYGSPCGAWNFFLSANWY